MKTPPEGFKHVGEWRQPGSYRAGLALPVTEDGRVLLQLRDDIPNIAQPGRWGFFGGGIEDGETAHETVTREFEEETGFSYSMDDFVPSFSVMTGEPKWGVLHIFVLKLTAQPQTLVLNEGAGFGYCTRSQAEKLDIIPCIREVLNEYWSQCE